jgi:hypothetical protein
VTATPGLSDAVRSGGVPLPAVGQEAASHRLPPRTARWIRRADDVLGILTAHRVLRLAVLLAANAFCMPYGNLFHDAQLYGLQVMNRVAHRAFANDLFLRFGSHEAYTPFPLLAAPIAALLGIEWSFFIFFLVFNTLLIVAIDRVLAALVDEGRLRTLAALLVVMTPLSYGGLNVFRVQEYFFTPRAIATGLVLFGLASSARGRHTAAFVLAVSATIVHPLMGVGAVLVVVMAAYVRHLSSRTTTSACALAVACGLVTVLYHPLGNALFGTIDPEWLLIIREVSPYALVGEWIVIDWVRTAVALGFVAGAGLVLRHDAPQRAWVFLGVALIAALGVAATAVAVHSSYRLLIQAQPYRALWMAHALAIPAALILARHAWRRGRSSRIVAVLVLAVAFTADFTVYELLLPLVILIPTLLVRRRRGSQGPESVATALATSVVLGFLAWGFLKLTFVIVLARDFLQIADITSFVRKLVSVVPVFMWLGVVLTCLSFLTSRRRLRLAGAALGITLALGVHALAFAVNESRVLRARLDPYAADVDFARRFVIDRYGDAAPRPIVYAGAWGDTRYVWFDMHAQSYLGGLIVIFSRDTALETRRRSQIVGSFERARYGDAASLPEAVRRQVTFLFGERSSSRPTTADLGRVCATGEGVDVAVLSQRFRELVSAGNGRVFLYECARVRALMKANT